MWQYSGWHRLLTKGLGQQGSRCRCRCHRRGAPARPPHNRCLSCAEPGQHAQCGEEEAVPAADRGHPHPGGPAALQGTQCCKAELPVAVAAPVWCVCVVRGVLPSVLPQPRRFLAALPPLGPCMHPACAHCATPLQHVMADMDARWRDDDGTFAGRLAAADPKTAALCSRLFNECFGGFVSGQVAGRWRLPGANRVAALCSCNCLCACSPPRPLACRHAGGDAAHGGRDAGRAQIPAQVGSWYWCCPLVLPRCWCCLVLLVPGAAVTAAVGYQQAAAGCSLQREHPKQLRLADWRF